MKLLVIIYIIKLLARKVIKHVNTQTRETREHVNT